LRVPYADFNCLKLPLTDAVEGYKNFDARKNEWTKVVLKPTGVRQVEQRIKGRTSIPQSRTTSRPSTQTKRQTSK
jgi:hypothetical protein